MMRLEKAGVIRNGRRILHDITLELHPGKVTVVIGVNGAGKSTMVRLMSGEWGPDEGILLWKGGRLSDMDPMAVARRRAVVPQHSEYRFAFSVEDVVGMGRYPHRASTTSHNRRLVRQALEETGLSELGGRSVLHLSGGERRRVLLARALVQLHEARKEGEGVLILDEPTSHLDLGHQERMLTSMTDCAREGIAVFAVLHDLNHAARVAEHLALIDKGQILKIGAPSDVLRADVLSRVFGVRMESIPRPGHPSHWVPAVQPDADEPLSPPQPELCTYENHDHLHWDTPSPAPTLVG
ncbi:MAG: heme ABC transporter ATP-binding protein [Kiritimatiellae bacterium]|jgi:iron complex transport system ATP-binding protein|nr:heme ABC transporter ATP-binding protein [Kiritimatiellia bacterium]